MLSFFRVSVPAFLAMSIAFCAVSIAVLGESIFSPDPSLPLFPHDEQDEIENMIAAASNPILNEVFILLMFKVLH